MLWGWEKSALWSGLGGRQAIHNGSSAAGAGDQLVLAPACVCVYVKLTCQLRVLIISLLFTSVYARVCEHGKCVHSISIVEGLVNTPPQSSCADGLPQGLTQQVLQMVWLGVPCAC